MDHSSLGKIEEMINFANLWDGGLNQQAQMPENWESEEKIRVKNVRNSPMHQISNYDDLTCESRARVKIVNSLTLTVAAYYIQMTFSARWALCGDRAAVSDKIMQFFDSCTLLNTC